MNKDRKPIEPEIAEKLLPETDTVHTFRQVGETLIGADWKKEDIIRRFKTNGVEAAGELARKINHGLASFDEANGWLFIQTREK